MRMEKDQCGARIAPQRRVFVTPLCRHTATQTRGIFALCGTHARMYDEWRDDAERIAINRRWRAG